MPQQVRRDALISGVSTTAAMPAKAGIRIAVLNGDGARCLKKNSPSKRRKVFHP
jgi:hypothetical protein